MNGYYELVVKQLRAHGFSLLRQTGGAHQIWSNGSRNVTVSTNCYSRHTAAYRANSGPAQELQ